MSKKGTRLTHAQFYKLCEVMKNREEWFKTNTPHFEAAAKFLSGECGFEVNSAQAQEASAVSGVTWVNPIQAAKLNGKKATVRLAEAEAFIQRLLDDNQKVHAAIDVLRGLVHQLYFDLNAAPPPGYQLPPRPGKPAAIIPPGGVRK